MWQAGLVINTGVAPFPVDAGTAASSPIHAVENRAIDVKSMRTVDLTTATVPPYFFAVNAVMGQARE